MTDIIATVFWLVLGISALLTWYGISQLSSRALIVAAALAMGAAIPAALSIGPFIMLVAVLQLVAGLVVRWALLRRA